jgi:hypothetical protein
MGIQKKREYRDAVIRIRDCGETLKAALVTDSHSPKQIEQLADDIQRDLAIVRAYAAHKRSPLDRWLRGPRLDPMPQPEDDRDWNEQIAKLETEVLSHNRRQTGETMRSKTDEMTPAGPTKDQRRIQRALNQLHPIDPRD